LIQLQSWWQTIFSHIAIGVSFVVTGKSVVPTWSLVSHGQMRQIAILCGPRVYDLSISGYISPFWHRGCTPLSSTTPRRRPKNLFFPICIKLGQNFINVFSWVDVRNIYYIGKMVTKFDDFLKIKHTVSN
jgi:hypothetical protein